MEPITIGLDIAKNVFQLHGVDASGKQVVSARLRRERGEKYFAALPPCVVVMEACGSAHHWARVVGGLGHEMRLVPAAYVRPFVKRNKTDARASASGAGQARAHGAMAFGRSGPQAGARGRRRAGRQDGAHRLGDADVGRELSGAAGDGLSACKAQGARKAKRQNGREPRTETLRLLSARQSAPS